MMKIKILTGTLELKGVEEYNKAYLKYLNDTKHMSQSVWWEEDKLIKNISSNFIQDPNIKNFEKIDFLDQEYVFIFEKENVFYITKHISKQINNKVIFQSEGRYAEKRKSGYNYNYETKKYDLILDENLIFKSFLNYKEFITEVSKIKIKAKIITDARELHCKHIDLIGDLNSGLYPKLGKLVIKVDKLVRVYFQNILIFQGYSNSDNYWHTEYKWLHEGKFQKDIFILLEKEKQKRIVKKEKEEEKKKLQIEKKLKQYETN